VLILSIQLAPRLKSQAGASSCRPSVKKNWKFSGFLPPAVPLARVGVPIEWH